MVPSTDVQTFVGLGDPPPATVSHAQTTAQLLENPLLASTILDTVLDLGLYTTTLS